MTYVLPFMTKTGFYDPVRPLQNVVDSAFNGTELSAFFSIAGKFETRYIPPSPRFGIINAMDKPELIIIGSWEGLPLKGGCSACPDVIFDAGVFIGNEHQQGITLRSMFEVHYREKHASPEESYPSKDRQRAPFTESTPIEAVTEEGGEEIKHWLELADAALNDDDQAA